MLPRKCDKKGWILKVVMVKIVRHFTRCFINFILEGTKIMSFIQDAIDSLTTANDTLKSVDTKLDEVKAFVANLEIDQPFTVDQKNILSGLIDGVKTESATLLSKAAALEEKPVVDPGTPDPA